MKSVVAFKNIREAYSLKKSNKFRITRLSTEQLSLYSIVGDAF